METKKSKTVAEVKAEETPPKSMSVWEVFRASLPKPPIRTRG